MPFDNLKNLINNLSSFSFEEELNAVMIEKEKEILEMRDQGKSDDEIRNTLITPEIKRRFTEKTGLKWDDSE